MPFVPLDQVEQQPASDQRRGFVPLSDAEDSPSLLKTIALENPATAAGEAALNFGSQVLSLPAAGLAGLATAAGRALGVTDREPADVVRDVGERFTYQPRGEFGKGAAEIVAAPFKALAAAGEHVGDAVLEATGSPAAATAADTAVQALPMVFGRKGKGKNAEDANAGRGSAEPVEPASSPSGVAERPAAARGFIPLEEIDGTVPEGAGGVADHAQAMPGAEPLGLEVLRRQGSDSASAVDQQLRAVPGRHGTGADTESLARPPGREGELHPGQLSVDRAGAATAEANKLPARDGLRPGDDSSGSLPTARDASLEHGSEAAAGRVSPGQSARGETLPGLDVADLSRRDATASRMGEAGRNAGAGAVVEDQARVDRRTGADEPRQALLTEGTALEARLFAGGDLANSRYRAALRRDPDKADAIDAARVRLNEIRLELGLPTVEEWAVAQGMPASVAWVAPPKDMPSAAWHPHVLDQASGVQNGAWNPGANHAGFVDQVQTPKIEAEATADLPAPIRRDQIIKDFADAIGLHVYEGRVKGENRLGFFRPRVEEVRTKRANDIEVVAHEIFHAIDHRIPEIANAWRSDKALREELRSISYDSKKVSEGWAEAGRLYLTQPETLEARAPRVYAWLEDFANSHKYGPALRQAQERMTAWFGQDALNRARSKIGTEKPLAEYFDRFWDKLRQATVDDLHGIYRMEKDLAGKINPVGPYESARLSRASASIADGSVRFGYPVKLPDGSFKFRGKGLEEILRPVSKEIDDALLYFVGRSARELMTQGREHLFTNGEIDAMLRLRTPDREQAFKDYQEWNRGILDFAEAQGVINPESRRLWQRTQYLPFHRVDQPGGLKGKPGDWSGIQALTGGTTNIKDVLGNMTGNAAMLIDKAVKNEARRKIANLSQRDGGGRFMVKIDAESRPVKISGDQVIDAMLKKYGIAVDGDAPAFFEFLIKGQPPAGNNVVAVLQGGKPVWFEVGDPIVMRALQAIDRPVMNEVVKWLALPKRIGQLTITATPDFWMANIARDTIMGSVMSRHGFKPILSSLEGMRLRLTKDPLYQDYLSNGGGLSSIFLDEHHLRTKLEKYYRDQKIDYRTVMDTPDKILTMMELLGDAFEMSTRLGEYKRAVQAGENPRHAAYLGRDVSTDFAMKGDSKALGFMYDTVMFLRPALVSWDRLYRGLAHDPNKGAIATKAGLMALMSAGLYLLNRSDPRYADLPDWDRDSHWHFFIGDQHFRYPKIWEIGAMSSAAERAAEKIIDADPQGLGKDFARILGATFSLNLMPQLLAPLYEQARNRNSFTNAPIETPGMENVQPFLRAKPGTSETMKAAGMATRDLPEALQVNPTRAEALLRGYFNTYALYGLMLSDQALFGDKLPAKHADELPVVRRFYEQEPARQTRYETEFYDLLQEAKRLRGSLHALDTMGEPKIADQMESSPLAAEAKPLEKAAHNLSTINNDMAAVRRDQSLTPGGKRARLDALTVERNALLKQAVIDSKAAQKERAN